MKRSNIHSTKLPTWFPENSRARPDGDHYDGERYDGDHYDGDHYDGAYGR